MDINFLIISWRGYSGNPGNPSETGLYKDALGGIEWLNKKGIFLEKDTRNFLKVKKEIIKN